MTRKQQVSFLISDKDLTEATKILQEMSEAFGDNAPTRHVLACQKMERIILDTRSHQANDAQTLKKFLNFVIQECESNHHWLKSLNAISKEARRIMNLRNGHTPVCLNMTHQEEHHG